MTTSVSQAAISVAYFPSPVPENNSPKTSIHAGTEAASGLPGLITGLAKDEKNVDRAIDIVARTCDKIIGGIDTKIALMNETQAQRQGAMADLLQIATTLGDYKNANPGQKGAIDLSGVTVTLSKTSQLYVAGKTTAMPLEELIAYYRQEHPELALPHMPTTIDGLNFLGGQINNALHMSLEPASQATYTELQSCMLERRAMQEMQSTMFRLIFDAFKKFIS